MSETSITVTGKPIHVSPYVMPGFLDEGSIRSMTSPKRKLTTVAESEPIIHLVCREFNLPHKDLQSRVKPRKVVEPRQIAMWLLRNNTKLSLSEIGKMVGRKDHSTVSHAVNVVNDRMKYEKESRQTCERLQALVVKEILS